MVKISYLTYSFLFFIFLLLTVDQSKGQSEFTLLKETGNSIDSLPEMVIVSDTSSIYKLTQKAIATTFMGDAIKLYHLAQQYLINSGQLDVAEPAYLAISTHQGGFAKKGFVLNDRGIIIRKPNAHYVDLTENNLRAPFDRLQSITQLYPHELMHVIFKLLSSHEDIEATSFNINMHYFSIITDFNTAFNEGFAEHMENISRLNEKNDSVSGGLKKQVERTKDYVLRRGGGFENDIRLPLRLNYYKVAMLIWFDQFEDYKRYIYALGDEETFIRSDIPVKSVSEAIMFRNTGINNPRVKKKNRVQQMASEGFVSTFLTHLSINELPSLYQSPSFYKQFLKDTTALIDPRQVFTPIQNLFVKYFYVLNKYVIYEKSQRAQLIDFINGYLREFPNEAPVILNVYKELSGMEFKDELPPPVWYLVRGYQHPALVLDPFGAITVPIYTFDINMAEAEDLMTLSTISRSDADIIVNYRDQNGFFNSYEDVASIPDLSKNVREALSASVMDEKYFNSLDEENLSISALIITPLLHLLKKTLIYFLILFVLIYYLQPKESGALNLILTSLKFMLLWILFVLSGLAAVVINGNPINFLLVILGAYLVIAFVVLRNRKQVLMRNYLVTGAMFLIILYSVI